MQQPYSSNDLQSHFWESLPASMMYNPCVFMTTPQPQKRFFFSPSNRALIPILILLLGLGLTIRLYDLTDLPLDFHATRQLFSAIKARGMYYETLENAPPKERAFAVQQWKKKSAIEPEILERLTAFTYRFTGERLWIARLYSSLFWVVGAIFLFLLARNLTSTDGGIAALVFYLFLPYAVFASRSFQPDPLMTALLVAYWWAINRWSTHPTWRWTFLTGLLGGLTILVKFVAAFFVIGGTLGVVLSRWKWRQVICNPKIWGLILLGALPGTVYLYYGIFVAGFLGQYFGGRFIPTLLLDPLNYWRWFRQIEMVTGGIMFVLGLLGLFFVEKKAARSFLIGLWVTYGLYGLYFNYHIASHDYYSLPLIPIVALSLAAPVEWMLSRLAEVTANTRLLHSGALFLLAFGLGTHFLNLRSEMKAVDYRPQAAYWAEIGRLLAGENTVALTQDYGTRLIYWGWRSATYWPNSGDIYYHADLRNGKSDFEEQFAVLTKKKRYFLVTDLDDLERQPWLKERLFGAYSLYAQGDGFLIFDLYLPVMPESP